MVASAQGQGRIAVHNSLPNANPSSQVQPSPTRNHQVPSAVPWKRGPQDSCERQGANILQNVLQSQKLSTSQVSHHRVAVRRSLPHREESATKSHGRAEGYRKAQAEQRASEDGDEQSEGDACRASQGGCIELVAPAGVGGQASRDQQAGEACCGIGEEVGGGENRHQEDGRRPATCQGAGRAGPALIASQTQQRGAGIPANAGPKEPPFAGNHLAGTSHFIGCRCHEPAFVAQPSGQLC
mmetsp:Transcript_1364/g.3358  ORF Transcript_1364/g.3358 Transcript_1364/m.3358 type:complete len:240 (+) Transcript_1364:2932-3651(+)